MADSISRGDVRRFQAALVHNARLAIRRLREDPVTYLPLAVAAAGAADIHQARRIRATLAKLLSGPSARFMARLVFDTVPVDLAVLNPLAIEAGVHVASKLRIRTEEDRLAKAEIWNGLSERYAASGDSRAGWRCAQRAVRLMRRLVSENRDHIPYLITVLLVLSKRCSELGQHDRAILLAEDAESRAQAAARDLKSLRQYIATLDVLSNRLSMAGRDDASLEVSARAAALVEDAVGQGAPFDDEHAVCQLRLATAYTRMRRFEECLPHAEAASRGFQALAHQNPHRYANLYWAAVDLVVGARASLDLPPCPDALVGEARSYFSELARQFPSAFLPRLMKYLVRESAAMAGEVANDASVSRAEEAAAAAREVAKMDRGIHCEDAGHVLFHLAQLRFSRGEFPLAVNSANEAITLFRRASRRGKSVAAWLDEAIALRDALNKDEQSA